MNFMKLWKICWKISSTASSSYVALWQTQRDHHLHNTIMYYMPPPPYMFFLRGFCRQCSRSQGGEQIVNCVKLAITSRSHAKAARHGVQLIPLQERSGARRNDHHMTNLSTGHRWKRERERHSPCVWLRLSELNWEEFLSSYRQFTFLNNSTATWN